MTQVDAGLLADELEKLELQLLHGDQHDRSTANIIGRAIHFLRASPPEAGVREELDRANYKMGWWLAGALEDPEVCAGIKAVINTWFEAHQPGLKMPPVTPSPSAACQSCGKPRSMHGFDNACAFFIPSIADDYIIRIYDPTMPYIEPRNLKSQSTGLMEQAKQFALACEITERIGKWIDGGKQRNSYDFSNDIIELVLSNACAPVSDAPWNVELLREALFPSTTHEFTNELGNIIRVTIEGPTSKAVNDLTPMETRELNKALTKHCAPVSDASREALIDALTSVRAELDLHKAPKLAAKIDAALAKSFDSTEQAPK